MQTTIFGIKIYFMHILYIVLKLSGNTNNNLLPAHTVASKSGSMYCYFDQGVLWL